MKDTYLINIQGYEKKLPIVALPTGVNIIFFNLHGDRKLTEHCAVKIAEQLKHCDVLITAESKGLQLTHCVAAALGHDYYAVCRKSKKLYMQDGIHVTIRESITTGRNQMLHLSKNDMDLLKGKKVGIVDDVVSTGNSLRGLEDLVKMAGGTIAAKAFVLAEGDATKRDDIIYLESIPLL